MPKVKDNSIGNDCSNPKELEIVRIETEGVNPKELAERITGILKEKQLYRENLMYRGVSEYDLETVKKYGTEKSEEKGRQMLRSISDDVYSSRIEEVCRLGEEDPWDLLDPYSSGLKNKDREETLRNAYNAPYKETIEGDFDPTISWVLPEEGLETCISKYGFEDELVEGALIFVYKPEFLVNNFEECFHQGKTADKIPIKDLLDETFAEYTTIKGHTFLDAGVLAIEIINTELM